MGPALGQQLDQELDCHASALNGGFANQHFWINADSILPSHLIIDCAAPVTRGLHPAKAAVFGDVERRGNWHRLALDHEAYCFRRTGQAPPRRWRRLSNSGFASGRSRTAAAEKRLLALHDSYDLKSLKRSEIRWRTIANEPSHLRQRLLRVAELIEMHAGFIQQRKKQAAHLAVRLVEIVEHAATRKPAAASA